jgi:hypothetical protein
MAGAESKRGPAEAGPLMLSPRYPEAPLGRTYLQAP